MSLQLNVLVKQNNDQLRSQQRSRGIEPVSTNMYDMVPVCECPKTRKSNFKKITSRLQESFKKIVESLTKRYGALKTTSVEMGEGSFGMVFTLTTQDNKRSFVVKTQKCHSCNDRTNHAELFMKEINAIQKIIKDKNSLFLLPYQCAYFPTQPEPFWFSERVGKRVQLQSDAQALGLIVMDKMERSMNISANDRRVWTKDTQKLGGWLSFIWSGSLLGIMGELMVSNAFHSDLKEDNIVGSMVKANNPFTYVWKAIDFGGSGTASNSAEFTNAMYTPHYTPMTPVSSNLTQTTVSWAHDMTALAHIVRNTVSFMTSTTKHPTPYSGKSNVERFFQTTHQKRKALTVRVMDELESISKTHKGVSWCLKWIHDSIHTNWNKWDPKKWWQTMAISWLMILDEASDSKPKMWKIIPIRDRIKKLISLLK